MLFVSGASIVGNTILKGHMHRYEWSRDIDSGTAATRKAPLVNERYRRSRNSLFFWPKNPAHTDNLYRGRGGKTGQKLGNFNKDYAK